LTKFTSNLQPKICFRLYENGCMELELESIWNLRFMTLGFQSIAN